MISGWYGQANSGDEAILQVFLDQMEAGYRSTIYVLTSEPDAIDNDYMHRGTHGVRHWEYVGLRGMENLLRGRIFRPIQLLRGSNLFVFGGGSLLRDNTTWTNLFRLLDDIVLAKLFGIPVVFYAIGVGPFRSWLGRKLIGYASRCATAITVRDETSAALLRDVGVPTDRITVVTDPAFLLPDADAAEAASSAGLTEFLENHPKTLFFYPTESLELPPPADTEENLITSIAGALRILAEQDGYAIVLLPLRVNSGSDDVFMSRRIRKQLPPGLPVHVVTAHLSPTQIRALTQIASINVTVRLHAMIYAASCGIPSVSINYEPKVRANAARFGIEHYVVEPDEEIEAGIVTATRSLAIHFAAEQAAMETRLPDLKQQARIPFTMMARLLNPPTQ